MNKNESQKFSNNNNQNILDEEFFDSFAPSKKITVKKKKINELITNLKQNKEYLSSLLSINNRQKLSKLYELILLNLTENNNTFVLNQLELIEILPDVPQNGENRVNINQRCELREDIETSSISIDEVLSNAPQKKAGCFVAPGLR